MQKQLNLKVKYRESFRLFAPYVLSEDASEWFDIDSDSPYMLMVASIKNPRRQMTGDQNALFGIDKLNVQRSYIPAVTHVDYTDRIQTVHAGTHPKYHALITQFKELTSCPIIVNTSFMCAVSLLFAHQKMPFAALWAPIRNCSLLAT